jgi:hypothetical protein
MMRLMTIFHFKGELKLIVIKVELHSAVNGRITELARMIIANDGSGSKNSMNYNGLSFRGRSKEQLDKETIIKTGRVEKWKSDSFHVWNLVSKMLLVMGYSQGH